MRKTAALLIVSCAVLTASVGIKAGQAQPPAAPPAQTPAPAAPGGGGPGRGPQNIKVLPKTWANNQIGQVMNTFTQSLGVQCNFCHADRVGAPPPAPGRGPQLDYTLDTKPEKEVARKMITMVMAINADSLKGIGEETTPEKVSCFTCHQGDKKPLATPKDGWTRGGFSLLPAGPVVAPRGAGPGAAPAGPAAPGAPVAPAGPPPAGR